MVYDQYCYMEETNPLRAYRFHEVLSKKGDSLVETRYAD